LSIVKTTLGIIPDIFASAVAAIGIIVTYKMASKQNKINFISNKRMERVELLLDEISNYSENAKIYFEKTKPIKENGQQPVNENFLRDFASDFSLLFNKILIRIDDEYEGLRQLVIDIHVCVLVEKDMKRLYSLCGQMIDSAKKMAENEDEKIKADIGFKENNIRINSEIKKYILKECEKAGEKFSKLVNFYLKVGIKKAKEDIKNMKNSENITMSSKAGNHA
jgi:hypothetical protein